MRDVKGGQVKMLQIFARCVKQKRLYCEHIKCQSFDRNAVGQQSAVCKGAKWKNNPDVWTDEQTGRRIICEPFF